GRRRGRATQRRAARRVRHGVLVAAGAAGRWPAGVALRRRPARHRRLPHGSAALGHPRNRLNAGAWRGRTGAAISVPPPRVRGGAALRLPAAPGDRQGEQPMARRRQLYEGKAKVLFEGPEPGTLVQYFKDDATAGNGAKKGIITGKGVLNN